MLSCKVCGAANDLQQHHIIGGRGKRRQHATTLSVVPLCWTCHHSTTGVHGREGAALNLKLRLELQAQYFALGYSEDEVRRLMGGRLYVG